jgi:hypothetical protein
VLKLTPEALERLKQVRRTLVRPWKGVEPLLDES